MLGYAKSIITSYSSHPLLVSCFIISVIFLSSGYVVESFTGNGVASAHFAVYGVISAILGTVGYLILFTVKMTRRIRRKSGAVA